MTALLRREWLLTVMIASSSALLAACDQGPEAQVQAQAPHGVRAQAQAAFVEDTSTREIDALVVLPGIRYPEGMQADVSALRAAAAALDAAIQDDPSTLCADPYAPPLDRWDGAVLRVALDLGVSPPGSYAVYPQKLVCYESLP